MFMLLILTSALAACGFQPRREIALPEALAAVRVETADPQDPLRASLEAELERAGARIDPGNEASVLRVSSARLDTQPLSTDVGNRVLEFGLRYRAEVQWLAANGTVFVAARSIEIDRDYRFDTADALGSPDEDELNRDEMVAEMSAAIMRSLRAALQP